MRIRRPTLKHAFETALDDARDRAGDEPRLEAEGIERGSAEEAVQKFQSALDLSPEPASYVTGASLAAAYGDEGPAEGVRIAEEPGGRGPAPEARVAPEAAAPRIRPGMGVLELKRLRRRLALMHHPDRAPGERREEASQAMARVNAEIDAALKRAREGKR